MIFLKDEKCCQFHSKLLCFAVMSRFLLLIIHSVGCCARGAEEDG